MLRCNQLVSPCAGYCNQFLSFFDSSVEERLREALRDAEARLNENLEHERKTWDTVERLDQLAATAMRASSAFLAFKEQVAGTSAAFNEEFARVTMMQTVETGLWEGLLELKNHIWATDYVSTRDKSLRQILILLSADDAVFMRQDYYENAEVRIREAIRQKLGENGLKSLMMSDNNASVGSDNQTRDSMEL